MTDDSMRQRRGVDEQVGVQIAGSVANRSSWLWMKEGSQIGGELMREDRRLGRPVARSAKVCVLQHEEMDLDWTGLDWIGMRK